MKVWVVKRPARLPLLPAPQPPLERRTSMPPPGGGAMPASTVISVAITLVTCAAVSGARYKDEDGTVVVNTAFSGALSVMVSNSKPIDSAASFEKRNRY